MGLFWKVDFLKTVEAKVIIIARYVKPNGTMAINKLVGNPNRKKMHIFGFVGIFEYIC